MNGQRCAAEPNPAGGGSDEDAFDGCEADQSSPRRAPRAQEREVAPIALDDAESSQIGQAERDQRAGHGEHHEQRLRIKRVAGCGRQRVAEVVHELDSSW